MHSWVRAFGVLAASTVLALSCTDANNPFGPDQRFQVQLAPRYAETAVSIASEPITEIRLTVKNASTGAVVQVETRVASEVETPDGSAWEVELEVTPPSDGSNVTILVELLNAAGETEWSGETGPIAVSIGSSSVAEDVEIFPGPPANLSVEGVEITTAPATLLEGDTSRLAASVTGGEEGARVVWSSITADLASVDGDGLATALLPGVARIQAAAGPAADTVELEVLPRPDSVLVTPATAILDGIGTQVQLQAAVIDARGDTLAGEAVTWRVADPGVVSDLGDGLFEAVSTGQTEATVLVASDTTVRTMVPLTVAVPNLVAARASVTTTLPPDTVVEGDSMTVDLAILNEGTAEAGATTYALQVLDPADLTVVDDTIVALNALAAGDSLVASHTFDTDFLSHWPDSVRFRMVVDDGGLVVESDETDNTITTGVFQLRRAVGSVVVSPAVDTLTRVGDTIRFTAEVLATDGSPLTERSVTWSSSNTAVATVDGSGLATAVDFGSALISATSEDVSGTGELVVESTVPAGFTRQWLGGDPAGPTTWSVAGNWDPIGAPTLADTIVISSAATNQPVLDANASVGGLTVEPGATLDLASFTLTVDGSVSAGQTIVGAGTLAMSGTGATLSGTVSNLLVQGDVSLADATNATGVVRVDGTGATLAVAGHTLTADSLHVANQGLLAMTGPSDTVRIATGAYFAGRSTTGSMTDGQLEVGGSFTQVVAGDATSFDASGAHRTLLDGAAAQTVAFGSGSSGFHHLRVENTVGVDFPTPALLSGDFVLGPSAVVSSGDVRAAGGVTTDATSSLTLNPLHVGGVMNVQGTYDVLTTRYTGTGGQLVQPGLPYGALEIWGDVALGGAVTTSGPVTVSGVGVNLDVNGQTLTVGDSLFVTGQGLLTMSSGADVVDVANGARFGGGDTQATLTAGTLRVAGPFTQANAGTPSSFAASGTHTTILHGTALQAVSFTDPTASHFHHLQITNTSGGGVSISGTATAAGDFTLAASAVLDAAAGTLVTGGQVLSEASSTLTLQALELVDDTMSIGGSYSVGTTVFAEAPDALSPQILQAGLPYQDVLVKSVARYTDTCGGTETISGNLTVSGSGATFIPGSYLTLTVQGNLATELGGILEMLPPSLFIDCSFGTFVVNGNATFGGGSTDGQLTSGTLTVAGDFTETATDAFRASGSHRTELNGTATVTFADTQPSHFHNLTVSGTTDVPETAWVGGNFHLTGGGSLTGVGQLGVDGNLTTDIGTALGVALVRVTGTLSVSGTYSVGRIIFSGGTLAVRQEIQANLPYQNITVEQFAKFPDFVNVDQSLTGNLVIESTGDFRPGACDLVTVGGDLDVIGTLTMGNPECPDQIDVSGNAIFRGGDTSQTLTDGVLRVAGDLTQTGTSSTASFSPSGLHQVVLNGTGAQTISFDNPGTTTSHFNDLEILNETGTITLLSDVHVRGILTEGRVGNPTIAGSGQTLNMEDASIDGLTFDNVLVELITPVTARPLNNVTFSANYSTAATQLYVEGPNTTFTFDALTFNTEPTGGGFYLHAHDTLFDEQVFTIDVLNSTPDSGFPYINTTGTDPNEEAIVNWSPPIF